MIGNSLDNEYTVLFYLFYIYDRSDKELSGVPVKDPKSKIYFIVS